MSKVRKMKPYTPEWQKQANSLARSYAPTIKPCRECGGPVAEGYCCMRCGTDQP